MNNKILLISVIVAALVVSLSAVSAEFGELTGGDESQDNVIEIDGISFNTTNATDFKKNETFSQENSDETVEYAAYRSDNGTGEYYFIVFDYSAAGSDDEIDREINEGLLESNNKIPYQTVNGVVVYTGSKISGVDVGKPVHFTYIQNADLDKIICLASSDPNETAKMASSVKFN